MSDRSSSKFAQWFIAFLLANEGVSAIAFALTAPILIGFAALGVEVGTWYVYNRRLQNAADVASIAAAVEVYYATDGTQNQSLARSIVPVEVARNGIKTAELASLTVNVPPTTGSHVGDNGAVEVILSRKYPRSFSALFSTGMVTENVRAVAATSSDGKNCLLALAGSTCDAIYFQGSSTANLNCGIASNSTCETSSINSAGSSQANVTIARTRGGISNSGGLHAGVTKTHASAVKDPYASLSVPSVICPSPALVGDVKPSQTVTLVPGTYCGGMKIQGTAILKPGIYIVAEGDFAVNSGAVVKIEGTAPYASPGGVTIILTKKPGGTIFAGVKIQGNTTVNLTAPTSGPWAGILFYQDRGAPVSVSSSDTNLINGNNGSTYKGVMYFPSRPVSLSGDATFPSGCLQVVAQTISLNGNLGLTNTCTDPSFKLISAIQVSLVE